MTSRHRPIRSTAIAACLALAAARAAAQSTAPATEYLDFGSDHLAIPPAVVEQGHVPRTAQLLGEAYRRKDPVVARRVQLVADLGQTALPAAAPFVSEALKDPAAPVRAEAARAAALVGDPEFLGDLEKLLSDADPAVRREAALAAAALARVHNAKTEAVEKALADQDAGVVSAGLRAAWSPTHATLIAAKVPTLTPALKADAADAVARCLTPGDAKSAAAPAEVITALLPLLSGDVPQRAAALRALGRLAPLQNEMILKALSDPHPTVRRVAIAAVASLSDKPVAHARAIAALRDADMTVREAAAGVLTPAPSAEALAALLAQLATGYAPLHQAARDAIARPATDAVRTRSVELATALLADGNPRRREDGSYVLGRLRSRSGMGAHVSLLTWDKADPRKTDWALVAQAAESLGVIGDPATVPGLMSIVEAAPAAITGNDPDHRVAMARAMAAAVTAAARLHHAPALEHAVRILKDDPLGNSPSELRSAAAFAVGVLAPRNEIPQGVNFFDIYASSNEALPTKFEALKALGNLRHARSADRLKQIAAADPAPDLRFIAHWSYERCANTTAPYTPPVDRREPPVSITDLGR